MCVLADTISDWEFAILLVAGLLLVLISESR
jgi:hypothetical protein